MKKIPCLFERDFSNRRSPTLLQTVTPGCEWVLAGEGVATRKWDGTSCLVRGGLLFARYELRPGKTPPPGFEPAQEADPATGKQPGWVPVTDAPEFKWHREAFKGQPDGTYELCGPKVNANSERLTEHVLIRHGAEVVDAPRTFDGLHSWLKEHRVEGIVFHHPDGRMAKIRRDDYGEEWP